MVIYQRYRHYKNIAVHENDLHLQWVKWLGKAFCELALIFGSISSVGIFDRTAKVVLFLVLHRSKFPRELVSQHLDDFCGAAPAGDDAIYTFDNAWSAVTSELGIKLAPRDSPEKSFGPTTEGSVYGIHYDTVTQTWFLPEDKMARIMNQLTEAMSSTSLEAFQVWSLAGKIIHIKDIVPAGRFQVEEILRTNSLYTEKQDRDKMVSISDHMKRELWWWFTALQVCSKSSKYLDPDACLPAWALQGFTDAAGGTSLSLGSGCGALVGNWWSYIAWSDFINGDGEAEGGKRVGRKLSALELVGPLLIVSGGHEMVRGQPLKVFVDNAGSVEIWKKGYSTSCELSSTLVKAIHQVSTAIECRVDIVKITRCSNPQAVMADALSKAEFALFEATSVKEGIVMQENMGWVPQALLDWIDSPRKDIFLGDKILLEMSKSCQIIGYNC